MECMTRKDFCIPEGFKGKSYSMNEFEDYYYGYMVPDTGYLKYFALYLYDEGLSFRCRPKKSRKSSSV